MTLPVRLWRLAVYTLLTAFFCVGATMTPAHAAAPLDWSNGGSINVSNSTGTSLSPVLRAAPDGSALHLAWIESPGGAMRWQISYSTSTDIGKTWSAPIALSINKSGLSSTMQSVAMAVDTKGQVHLVWSERDHKRNLHVYYRRRSADGVWTTAIILAKMAASNGDAYSGAPNIDIAINKDAPDLIHVVWKGSPQPTRFAKWAIYYAMSDDGGTTWKDYQSLVRPRSGSSKYNYVEEPTLLAESNGNVHVVWRGKDKAVGLSARHKIGGVWGDIEYVDTYAHNMQLLRAPDNSGQLLVVYQGLSSGGNTRGIRLATWTPTSTTNGTWSAPQLIASENNVAVYLNHPTIQADAAGNVYVIYDRTTGQVGVAYRMRAAGSSAWSDSVTIAGERIQYPSLRFANGQLNLAYAGRVGTLDGSGQPGYDIVFRSAATPQ